MIDNLTKKHSLSGKNNKVKRNILRAIIGFTLYLFFVPALLFISAGTVNWPMAWVYVILLLASTLGSRLLVLMKYPDLLRERASFTKAEGTKPWDRILVAIVGLYGPMAVMIVAGLNHRFGWSPVIPTIGQYLAVLVIIGGYGMAVWAMAVNRYFSAVARIQHDRGQVVVTTGPYRIVRHPSYAGAIIASLALPIMLNAIWTMVPVLAIVVALIIRTKLEDRMLIEELDGYQSYVATTPYRLVPGIW